MPRPRRHAEEAEARHRRDDRGRRREAQGEQERGDEHAAHRDAQRLHLADRVGEPVPDHEDAEREPASLADVERWIDNFGTNFPMVADPDLELGLYASPDSAPPPSAVVSAVRSAWRMSACSSLGSRDAAGEPAATVKPAGQPLSNIPTNSTVSSRPISCAATSYARTPPNDHPASRYGPEGCTSRIIRTRRVAIPSTVRRGASAGDAGSAYTGMSSPTWGWSTCAYAMDPAPS